MEFIECPQCGALAEVIDRVHMPSTHGPLEHVRIHCVRKHWFFMPAGPTAKAGGSGRRLSA